MKIPPSYISPTSVRTIPSFPSLFDKLSFVTISANSAITLPLSDPLPNSDITALHIPKGTTITIGIGAANRDPLIWGADAHEWKPERWLGKRTDEVAFGGKLPGVYSGMCVDHSPNELPP